MRNRAELAAVAEKFWNSHKVLVAELSNDPCFPWRVSLNLPTGRAALADFAGVQQTIRALAEGEGAYRLEWASTRKQNLGSQRLPVAAIFDGADQLAAFIGKAAVWSRLRRAAALLRRDVPELADWFTAHPGQLVNHVSELDQIISVLRYFQTHPQPWLYIRELDIPGVDSKYIENRKRLLLVLLRDLLPAASLRDPNADSRHRFEDSLGLRHDQPPIRLRVLDPNCSWMAGVSDFSLLPEECAALDVSQFQRVFITENKINGLAFPATPQALVIFGLGYGLGALRTLHWLHDKPLFYWGDIDSNGFAMLDQLRKDFPHVKSLLMDQVTLLAHRELWGEEDENKRCSRRLTRLNKDELALYEDLCGSRWQPGLRLEQERIAFASLRLALRQLL